MAYSAHIPFEKFLKEYARYFPGELFVDSIDPKERCRNILRYVACIQGVIELGRAEGRGRQSVSVYPPPSGLPGAPRPPTGQMYAEGWFPVVPQGQR